MLKIVTCLREMIGSVTFGGKASGLSLLCQNGMRIPRTILVEATRDPDLVAEDSFRNALMEAILPGILQKADDRKCYDVAVRSSSTAEDSFEESRAGHFSTRIGKMNLDEIITCMQFIIRTGTAGNDAAMGIVIQEKIEADYSGVIFSSDPFTYRKKTMIISYTSGPGEKLVSGEDEGEDVAVSIQNGEYFLEKDGLQLEGPILLTLSRQVKKLEEILSYPVDVEWAVRNGQIYFLQCRPLASITKIPTTLRRVSSENLHDLPDPLIRHDKIKLRLFAQQKRIRISDATVFIKNNSGNVHNPVFDIQKTEDGKGYSAVMIYPERLSNKVVRSFLGDQSDVAINTDIMNCCRYGIRSFPEYDRIEKCMMEYSKRVSADYWISATIIQEIYDPMYTGILKRIPDGYIIEITQGHFLTKGVVPSSQYVITEEGDVVSKKETLQSYWYKILEGHVFYCICNEGDEKLVSITESELLKVKDALSPAIQNKSTVVEFGILIDRENHVFQPYLIDFVDDGANSMIEKNDIEDGVVSKGTISGKIVNMKETRYESLEMPDSQLDMHLHNEFRDQKVRPNKTGSEKNKIFFCKRPVISLLEIIDNHDPATIGFVFEEGSVLCHVAVVLREKGIPAIKTGVAPDEFREGVCTIDAGSAGLAGRDRVRYE